VAAITEAAMRGEITDFKDSLRRRVALLKRRDGGRHGARLHRAPAHQPRRGRTDYRLQGRWLKVLLVSGGFTFFADRVKERWA
jgi:phosphoserine phosphatase